MNTLQIACELSFSCNRKQNDISGSKGALRKWKGPMLLGGEEYSLWLSLEQSCSAQGVGAGCLGCRLEHRHQRQLPTALHDTVGTVDLNRLMNVTS